MRSEIGMSKLRSHGTEAIAMSALVLWAFAVLLMCRVVLRHRIITGMTSSSCEFFCAQRFLMCQVVVWWLWMQQSQKFQEIESPKSPNHQTMTNTKA